MSSIPGTNVQDADSFVTGGQVDFTQVPGIRADDLSLWPLFSFEPSGHKFSLLG
jgi:hypothetical protein